MPYKDPDRQREAQAAWAARKRKDDLPEFRRRSNYRRRRAFQFIKRVKEFARCHDCEIGYPYYVLQFDHVRGEKKSNVASMGSGGYAIAAIKKEMRKCEIVCANCHAIRTFADKC
jgi:hypothetical protein